MASGIPMTVTLNETQKRKIATIKRRIKQFVAEYYLDDSSWAEAISSQYFLLCLSKQLKWNRTEYERLLNKCLSCLSVTFQGNYIIDANKLLITPDETTHIVECMKQEDIADKHHQQSAKMKAENIDSQQMHMNFYYGLLIRIVASEDTDVLRQIKHSCLDSLLTDKAIDTSGGWYPYRVPWITARILISLRSVNIDSYSDEKKVKDAIENAINSLYQRIDVNAHYWRSGVGSWVSKWESTALCLEALYVWDEILKDKNEIKAIIDYVWQDVNKKEWLDNEIDFSTEEASNETLASVIMASVVARMTREYFPEYFESYFNDILSYLDRVTKKIAERNVPHVRQYCTIPQILHYVLSAFETNK